MNDNWTHLHEIYKEQDWIKLPSIFAEQAIGYFPKEGVILELGAGRGQDTIYFAQQGYNVTGTDLEIKALSESIADLPKDVIEKINVQATDLRRPLKFEDSSFDIVYAHLSLHYFDTATTERIFEEINRVLKPGGVLAFFTNSVSDPEYGNGTKIEDNFYDIDGVSKRYLDTESAKQFGHQFSPLLLDSRGETYKDAAKGIHNLIRFIGKKN
jgi:SAM-dependent methyltransferase